MAQVYQLPFQELILFSDPKHESRHVGTWYVQSHDAHTIIQASGTSCKSLMRLSSTAYPSSCTSSCE